MFSNSANVCRSRIPYKYVIENCKRLISTTDCKTNIDVFGPNLGVPQNKWIRQKKHENARILSTLQPKSVDIEIPSTSKKEAEEFINIFPTLVDDLINKEEYSEEPTLKDTLEKILMYSIPKGKKNRGLAVITSYKILEKDENFPTEKLKLANILGWCVEMLHSSFLSRDDIINDAKLRRGVLCWHRQPEAAYPVSTVTLVQNGIFNLLQKYFSDNPNYINLTNLFHYTILKTTMGQSLDALTLKDKTPNLDFFTMNTYNAIVKYKMAYYSFYLPVASAMYLAGNADPELHRQAKTILLEMGHFYRVQEDFLDCFGDKTITGHSGNDIREGRCSWLAVVALQRASLKQREIFVSNYGKDDGESEATIKQLYQDLGLPNTYKIYEEKSYNIIRHHIQQLSAGLPHDLFLKFMEKLYRRDCELFLF